MGAPSSLHGLGAENDEEEEEGWHLLGDVPFRKWTCYPAPLPCLESLNLDEHIVVGAAHGGPFAVMRDAKNGVVLGSERPSSYLRIYSSAGLLLGQAPWDLGSKVVCMGWTESEALVVISEAGHVHWYTVLGESMDAEALENSIRNAPNEKGRKCATQLFVEGSPRRVIEAQVWACGYVALSDDFTLHVYDGSISDPDSRLYRLSVTLLSGRRSPTSMAVLTLPVGGEGVGGQGGSRTGALQILLGTSDNALVMVDGQSGLCELPALQASLPGPVVKMRASPDSRFLACFAEGLLTVYATGNYSKVLGPFDAGTSQVPEAMGWCGKDALAMYWRGMGLGLVGPYGDFYHFPYAGEAMVVVQEVDSCRLWTESGGCEILQRVPTATEAIHRIGSTEPAAMLYDAAEAFQQGDPTADENIRAILASPPTPGGTGPAKGGGAITSGMPSSPSHFSSPSLSSSSGGGGNKSPLQGAIHACLRSALGAWDVGKQKRYLQAAAYGKGFADEEEQKQWQPSSSIDAGDGDMGRNKADEFVGVCRKLRVLNHLRGPAVGIPTTAWQLAQGGREDGWAALLDRLLLRRLYFLAWKVCEYLCLGPEKETVLVRWACALILSPQAVHLSDRELCDQIRRRFQAAFAKDPSFPPALSYAPIARTADQVRRRGLATLLLDYDSSASSQVDLLLEMGEFKLALGKALRSNNLDVAYRALFFLEAHKASQEAFLALLASHPSSLRLLRVYYRSRLTKESRTPWFNVSLARGDLMEAGTLVAFQAYAQDSHPRRIELLREAARLFGHQGKQPLSSISSTASSPAGTSSFMPSLAMPSVAATVAPNTTSPSFFHRVTEEQADLLEVQAALERRLGKNENVFVGLSVSETIYNLIVLASDALPSSLSPSLPPSMLLAEAARVAKKFKVPDKRFWHVKINALAASGQFENLKAFASEKKSPVGYKPFAQACIKHKQPSGVVETYIDRVASHEDRFDLYVEVRLWQKAAEAAFRLKDVLRLRQVQANCMMPGLQRSIDDLIAKLG